MKFRAAFFLLTTAIAFAPAGGVLRAENQTDAKIRLMGEALTARDAGDFIGAKRKLEALNQIVPNDAGVKRLMAEMDARQAEHDAALANPPPPPIVLPEPPRATTAAPSGVTASPSSGALTTTVLSPAAPALATATTTKNPPTISGPGKPNAAKPVTTVPSGRPESVEQVAGIAVITEERPAPPAGPPDRYAEALATVEKEGVAYARAGDDRWEKLMTYVQAQRGLARVYAHDGNYAAATATLDEALASLKASVDDLRSERQDYIRKEVEEREAKKGIHLRHRR
jgi:tetratricopeptide (TPR) repeat protein